MSKTYIPAALRRLVRRRADDTCEYCLRPEFIALKTYHVDHVISEKHLGTTEADNLALACPTCNLLKGSDIATYIPALDETVRLYHPRRDVWAEHFKLTPSGLLIAYTHEAMGTVQLLELNHPDTVSIRAVLAEVGELSAWLP